MAVYFKYNGSDVFLQKYSKYICINNIYILENTWILFMQILNTS